MQIDTTGIVGNRLRNRFARNGTSALASGQDGIILIRKIDLDLRKLQEKQNAPVA
jgi:hypothetical protein